MKPNRLFFTQLVLCFCIFVYSASSQTTAFTYQGKLNDGVNPANGNYDFELVLFDALAAGNQLGSIITINNVIVTNGIFAVNLDFGNQFTGADRYLEIRVRLTGQPGITILSPRQLMNSAPYSVKSLNAENAATATDAANLGGVAANQYVVTTDSRMTDARAPTAGSVNYIQNTNTQQAASNFNISGTGAANIFNAATQFNIGGNRILGNSGTGNLFAGINAGAGTTAASNSFFGASAGAANVAGIGNSFFGRDAGAASTSNFNSFFGRSTGSATTGTQNSFFGYATGMANISGSNNTLIGTGAEVGSNNLTNATALGFLSQVDCSNCLVLGSVAGVNNAANTPNVGIGTTSPAAKLEIASENNSTVHMFATSYGAVNTAFIGRQADGTFASPTATTNGRTLLFMGGRGHIGTGFATVSRVGIGMEATESWTATANGTRITFDTTEGGTTSRLERMRINHNGEVGIGTTAPDARLHVFDSTPALQAGGVIHGETNSSADHAYAVVGELNNTSPGSISVGVRGINRGTGNFGYGVWGSHAGTGNGVVGTAASGGVGVSGSELTGGAGFAGQFFGDVTVTGTLSRGAGAFKIDHPLDPANKYFYHSSVESPDMKNIYDGNVTTDAEGVAEVTLPEWFETLNRDFRYQLTVLGQFAQAIVGEEIKNNRFTIRTNLPNVKVSWQVTGIRKDAFAEKYRISVEEAKPEKERGSYLHPEAFNQPEEKGVEWALHPEMMKQLKEDRERPKQPAPSPKPDNEKPQEQEKP